MFFQRSCFVSLTLVSHSCLSSLPAISLPFFTSSREFTEAHRPAERRRRTLCEHEHRVLDQCMAPPSLTLPFSSEKRIEKNWRSIDMLPDDVKSNGSSPHSTFPCCHMPFRRLCCYRSLLLVPYVKKVGILFPFISTVLIGCIVCSGI